MSCNQFHLSRCLILERVPGLVLKIGLDTWNQVDSGTEIAMTILDQKSELVCVWGVKPSVERHRCFLDYRRVKVRDEMDMELWLVSVPAQHIIFASWENLLWKNSAHIFQTKSSFPRPDHSLCTWHNEVTMNIASFSYFTDFHAKKLHTREVLWSSKEGRYVADVRTLHH